MTDPRPSLSAVVRRVYSHLSERQRECIVRSLIEDTKRLSGVGKRLAHSLPDDE